MAVQNSNLKIPTCKINTNLPTWTSQKGYTLNCPDYTYNWTLSTNCCYGRYENNNKDPYCCTSSAYTLLMTLGGIGAALACFIPVLLFCWCIGLWPAFVNCATCGCVEIKRRRRKRIITPTPEIPPEVEVPSAPLYNPEYYMEYPAVYKEVQSANTDYG